jgi:ArsR family transcriptional regulator
MNPIQLYKCLCDTQRLRMLNLLGKGPLCVCHIMEILDIDQVKTSKQLRYMKELGIVDGERQAQWIVYRLTEPDHPLITENLKCLELCADDALPFHEDLAKRASIMERLREEPSACSEALLTENQECTC